MTTRPGAPHPGTSATRTAVALARHLRRMDIDAIQETWRQLTPVEGTYVAYAWMTVINSLLGEHVDDPEAWYDQKITDLAQLEHDNPTRWDDV